MTVSSRQVWPERVSPYQKQNNKKKKLHLFKIKLKIDLWHIVIFPTTQKAETGRSQ